MNRDRRPLATVLVPAYNEGSSLSARIDALMRVLNDPRRSHDYEVIVIDDGSTDQTLAAACKSALEYPSIRILQHPTNRGLGSAIRTGIASAHGYALVTYDADLSYRPQIVPELLEALDRSCADVALASPYMRGGRVRNVPIVRRILSREANRFLSFATSGRFATVTCMVRAYRAEFLDRIVSCEDRMEINIELLFKAIKTGASIVEVPATLQWSSERVRLASRMRPLAAVKQITRTIGYGVGHRPLLLLSVPGLLPGVLPLVVAALLLAHATLRTITMVTLGTIIVQNLSLAFFAGQLGVFFRNVLRRRAL